ncbi:16702_t:CDS:2, partial [Racocetra fulgida]
MDPTIDEIQEYGTEQLIEYLQTVKNLQFNEKHFEIIRKEEFTGETFLTITEEELRGIGLKFGSAKRLVNFAKTCSERKRQKYSSIKSLKDVLKDYNIDSDDISKIPLFEPQTHEIQDADEYFQNSLRIAEASSNNIFKMAVEYEVSDKIDKSMQEGFAQNIRQLEISHDVNKKKRKRDENEDFDYLYGIVTSEAWNKESGEYGNLCNNTKKVLSIIVGLLVDKVADTKPESKRIR